MEEDAERGAPAQQCHPATAQSGVGVRAAM